MRSTSNAEVSLVLVLSIEVELDPDPDPDPAIDDEAEALGIVSPDANSLGAIAGDGSRDVGNGKYIGCDCKCSWAPEGIAPVPALACFNAGDVKGDALSEQCIGGSSATGPFRLQAQCRNTASPSLAVCSISS